MNKEYFEDFIEPMVDIENISAEPVEPVDRSKMSEEEYQAMVAFCKRNGYKLNII